MKLLLRDVMKAADLMHEPFKKIKQAFESNSLPDPSLSVLINNFQAYQALSFELFSSDMCNSKLLEGGLVKFDDLRPVPMSLNGIYFIWNPDSMKRGKP